MARTDWPTLARTLSWIVAAAFLAAIWLGVKPIATSPQYCECGLLAEEIVSRLMALDIVTGAQTWLVSGSQLAAAVGLVVAGRLGREAGMPASWQWLALAAVAVALIGIVLPFFDVYPIDVVLVILVAGILVPIWAAWFGSRAREIWPRVEAPTDIAGG